MIINDVIFNAELEDILTELQNQLATNGIELLQKTKPTLTHIQVQCPYHSGGQERRPSAGIRRSDGMFHCFACNAVHTLPEVISHCFGRYDDVFGKWGWSWLNRNFATVQKEERKDVELNYYRKNVGLHSHNRNDSGGDTDDAIYSTSENVFVPEEELKNYRYIHPYMYERKLTDEIIELFDIGYDKNTDCITFPVHDVSGNTLFIARRSTKTKFFNYPEGVEKPLYGLYEYYHNKNHLLDMYCGQIDFRNWSDELIICESMLDALTAWVYGKYAVALNGLGNELQFKQLSELPCRKLILATDSDQAGMNARKRIRKNIHNKIITEYILPEGKKDLNELTQEEFNNLEEIF